MVHGVFDLDYGNQQSWNPLGKHLHRRQFEDSLKELTKHFSPISLQEILQHKKNNTWPDKPCFAISFDDGYAGFEKTILPLLEQHKCPASFFPVINFVDGDILWMDQVESIILASDNFVSPQGDLLPKDEAHNKWKEYLKKITRIERGKLLDKYFQLPEGHQRPQHHLAVSWDELRRLSSHELVSIGNHSLTHSILAMENRESISAEVLGAAERLRHELGSCDLFCYPNGGSEDHNELTKEIITETHHQCALLSEEALISSDSDPYLLPRFSLSSNTYNSKWFWDGLWGLRDLKKSFFN